MHAFALCLLALFDVIAPPALPPPTAPSGCTTEEVDDLDGDGLPEVELSCPAGHFEHEFTVYGRTREGARRKLGTWTGKTWTLLDGVHRHFHDVEVESAHSQSSTGVSYVVERYRFDGRRYRRVAVNHVTGPAPEPEPTP